MSDESPSVIPSSYLFCTRDGSFISTRLPFFPDVFVSAPSRVLCHEWEVFVSGKTTTSGPRSKSRTCRLTRDVVVGRDPGTLVSSSPLIVSQKVETWCQ